MRRVDREWISISDLMAGLMMVFLFIAVSFMIQVNEEKMAMAEIALTYERSKVELNMRLKEEFRDNLNRWGAVILEDNTVRFEEPDVLFAPSSSEITNDFREILENFFPRYLSILRDPLFKDDIDEIRIEGHTSSRWIDSVSLEIAYLRNARLSQDRSFSVLTYVYTLPSVARYQPWMGLVLRANGLSFAKRIFDETGQEDYARSRRVEFRVLTKTEEKIHIILEKAKVR